MSYCVRFVKIKRIIVYFYRVLISLFVPSVAEHLLNVPNINLTSAELYPFIGALNVYYEF